MCEEYFSSNQATLDNIMGQMKFATKLQLIKKTNKIWNFSVYP
jgi:hypothetical protein